MLDFWKYEGTANDFVVLEASDPALDLDEGAVSRLCDRHRGIGADGVLLVTPSANGADARMVVRNADGSRPEMCGNGVRCVAVHVRARQSLGSSVSIETDGGIKRCHVEALESLEPSGGEPSGMVTVDMGRIAVGESIAVVHEGRSLTLVRADAGNPHAITFDRLDDDELDALGARLQKGELFPHGVNLERAVKHERGIDVAVFERGVGRTLACGTGACAVAAVAVHRGLGRRDQPIAIALAGGVLEITIDARDHASMRGPARRVFQGTLARGRDLFRTPRVG